MRGRRKGGAPAVQSSTPEGIAAHADAFLRHLGARAYSQPSIDAHRWALRQFTSWSAERGMHDPAIFTRADLEVYQLFLHHYRTPRGGKALVINTQLARLGCIRRFFAWLCRSGTIPANPAADLDLPRKQARHLPKALDEQEIQRLLCIPNPADPFGLRDRAMLELFYATGIRRSEMANLDHGDYDASTHTLIVRKGKNGKSRMLPVGARAAAWLDRFLAESRPLFDHLPQESTLFLTGYGERFSPSYLGNWIKKLLKRCGIDKPGSCHLWRHSCATDMHRGGADIRYVQEMLGHERMETTKIYTHVHIEALREIHSRCHPHGKLGPDCDMNGKLTTPENQDSKSEVEFASHQAASSLYAAAMTTACDQAPQVSGHEAVMSRSSHRQDPAEDDPPDGIAPISPTPPPKSPKGGNSYKALPLKALGKNGATQKMSCVAYYAYRYYHPELGRWLSRDPIGIKGGINLYAFVENDGVNRWDYLGKFGVFDMGDGTGGADPIPPPPPAPTPGSKGKNASQLIRGYFYPDCCKKKRDRLKAIPGVTNPSITPIKPTDSPVQSEFRIFAGNSGAVGSMGADSCIALIVKCGDQFTAVFHFGAADDNPAATLDRFTWPSGCKAIICGGRESDGNSNCMGEDVEKAVKSKGISLEGVSPNSNCGVDADGNWWQNG